MTSVKEWIENGWVDTDDPAGRDLLPTFRLDSRDCTAAAAMEAWREASGPLFDISFRDPDKIENFRLLLDSHHLGQMVLAYTRSVAQGFRRDRSVVARSAVDHYLVQIYTAGGFAGVAGTRDMRVEAGDVSVLDMSQTLSTAAPDFANVSLVLPRETLAPLLKDPDNLHGLVLPRASSLGQLLGDHLLSLRQAAPRMTEPQAMATRQATAALIAGCFGPAAAAAAAAGESLRTASLHTIKRYIEGELSSPDLSPDSICRTFGLSRANLYRLFQPLGGVADYIRNRRLDRAFADLISPALAHRRVTDISYSWGFESDAAFSRAFRQAFGLTPRDARALRGSLPRHERDLPGDERYPALRRWIRELRAY